MNGLEANIGDWHGSVSAVGRCRIHRFDRILFRPLIQTASEHVCVPAKSLHLLRRTGACGVILSGAIGHDSPVGLTVLQPVAKLVGLHSQVACDPDGVTVVAGAGPDIENERRVI